MKVRETKEEEGANGDAKLGKWRKHTCSGRLIGGPHACSIVDSTAVFMPIRLEKEISPVTAVIHLNCAFNSSLEGKWRWG